MDILQSKFWFEIYILLKYIHGSSSEYISIGLGDSLVLIS